MGDKERSMEAEQEEEKEIQMALHQPPVYPLPEEINKMEHSETVCRYCGVSYLIFHEFHQLQTRLAQQEAELQELRETTQREKAQREALELGRLEWERALHLEVQRRGEEKEKSMREELKKKNIEMEKALRKVFDEKGQKNKREMEELYQKISEEKERQLRRELGELEAESLRKQRDELQRRTEEREKVLIDALQKANKNVEEQREYLQQLEERLSAAASSKEKAEELLGKEKQKGEILRVVCVRQQQALRATLSVLHTCVSELTDVRGFLSQLTEVWQLFRSQILQYSTQVSSVLTEELKHSREEFQKMREEKEHVTQQLMCLQEQKRLREEQLSQHEESEREHRQELLRLKGELEETQEKWLSCQRKCDTIQEQLLSRQQREEQMARKCNAAEEEVTRLGKTLEKVQQETGELRREREVLIESHCRVLTKMEEDFRQQMASKLTTALEEQRTQNALHLREQMKACRSELEMEMMIDKEKNQLLLSRYQRDNTQLQQKVYEMEEKKQEVQELKEVLQQEKRSREEEKRTQHEERKRREEELRQELQCSQQQEALQLSQTKTELQLMTERNTELQEEVALLQETVRRECEEREELTAALSKAQGELLRLQSPVSHQDSTRSPPGSLERHTPSKNKQLHLNSKSRVALARSSTFPNTLRPFLACIEKDRDLNTDGVRCLELGGVLGAEKKQEGTLPRLKLSSTMNEVKMHM
ncbi:leucine-, glutamate- and lysine-rich protein 1 [Anabas testudineus]|uniref:leucine-, glutamate- and lysine-rich protein 1 n=1 Tax=Anabas testudineus TaxID=64144 RepID=UPI000E45E9A3|nr:leucine-, glutamate- and lysine-rich protein 1 [Anabas testudineus]